MKTIKSFFMLPILMFALTQMIGCGGGGGGGGGSNGSTSTGGNGGGNTTPTTPPTPPPPQYLQIRSFSPTNVLDSAGTPITTTDIETNIVVDFNKPINPASLVDLKRSFADLVSYFAFKVEVKDETGGYSELSDVNSMLDDVEFSVVVDKYRLVDTLHNDSVYRLGMSADNNVYSVDYKRSFDPVANAVTYQLMATPEGGSSQVSVRDFTDQDLVNANVNIKSPFFTVQDQNGNSAEGVIVVDGSRLTFDLDDFLEWDTVYTVTVTTDVFAIDEDLNDDKPGLSMLNNKTWTFKTDPMPIPQITRMLPDTTSASVFDYVEVSFNFDVDVTKTNFENLVKIRKSMGAASDPVDVPAIYEYNASARKLTVKPAFLNTTIGLLEETTFEYNQRYDVTVLEGVEGTLGNNPVSVPRADWTFVTAPPRVDYVYPVASASDPDQGVHPDEVQDNGIEFQLNFEPELLGFENFITVTKSNGSGGVVNVPFTLTSSGSLTNLSNRFFLDVGLVEFDTDYTVTIDNSFLSAYPVTGLSLSAPKTWTFHTQPMKILSSYPANNASSFGITDTVEFEVNFDIDRNYFNNFSGANKSALNVVMYPSSGPSLTGYGVVSSTNSRIIQFSTDNFEYNESVEVTLLTNGLRRAQNSSEVLGNTVASRFIDFTTTEKAMLVSEASPSPNASNTDIWPLIFARFVTTIDHNSVFSGFTPAMNVRNCFGSNVSGDLYADGSYLYFNPTDPLISFCEYTVTVNNFIRGTDGSDRITQNNGTYVWSFITGGLEMTYFELSEDFFGNIDVDTNIIMGFNHNVFVNFSSGISISEDSFFSLPLLKSTSTFGNELTISPLFSLDYNTTYRVEVEFDAIEGANGETLGGTEVLIFTTEDDPTLFDTDHGPVGNVTTQGDFWVDFNRTVSSLDITDAYIEVWDDFFGEWVIEPSNWNVSSNTLNIISTSFLDVDKEYRITAYGPDFNTVWIVDTFTESFFFRPAQRSTVTTVSGTSARPAYLPEPKLPSEYGTTKADTNGASTADNAVYTKSRGCKADPNCAYVRMRPDSSFTPSPLITTTARRDGKVKVASVNRVIYSKDSVRKVYYTSDNENLSPKLAAKPDSNAAQKFAARVARRNSARGVTGTRADIAQQRMSNVSVRTRGKGHKADTKPNSTRNVNSKKKTPSTVFSRGK